MLANRYLVIMDIDDLVQLDEAVNPNLQHRKKWMPLNRLRNYSMF